MPYKEFSMDEAARYLHLNRRELEELVKTGEIPFEKRGGRVVFRRIELDGWASKRILGLGGKRLDEYHRNTTRATLELLKKETIMPELIKPEYIAPAMPGKTKASVLQVLVEIADTTGLVGNPKDLLKSLQEREELCSTGLADGLAVPHPRCPQEYLFESSFIIVGRTLQEIPFGAPDGMPSDLFFLTCCQDDRLHLHTLARICLMAQKTKMLQRLREAADAEEMHKVILESEVEALQARR